MLSDLRLCHLVVGVTDMDRALDFYRGLLGMDDGLVAVNKKLSWLLRFFVVAIPRLVNLDADDWRRGLHRRLHREDDGGNDRG